MDFLAILGALLQSGPVTPDAQLLNQISLAFWLVVLGSRAVVGPAIYLAARRRPSGREVWWGLLSTFSPLAGGIAFAVLGGGRKGEVTGAYNPWVACPWCQAPRGYSALPCPRCGQFLPVAGPYPPVLPAVAAPLPAPTADGGQPSSPTPPIFAPGPPSTAARDPAPSAGPGYPRPAPPGYAPARAAKKYRPLDITGSQVVGAILFTGLLANVWATLVFLPLLPRTALTQAQLQQLTQTPWFLFIAIAVQDSIFIGVALDQALFRKRLTLPEMGLSFLRKPFSVPQQVALGFAAGAAMFLTTALMLRVFIDTLKMAGIAVDSSGGGVQPRIQTIPDFGFSFASIVVIAPVAEELFFRGYALSGFLKSGQRNRGLVITASLFAAVHLNPFTFLPIMVVGLVLGSLRVTTGSLVSPIVAHATNNLMVATLILFGY